MVNSQVEDDIVMGRADEPLRRAIASLQRLGELLTERRAQLAREAGLSEHQWRLLEEISSPGFLPSLFARRSEVTAAAVSKVLRQLLDKGLIEVSIDEQDARQRRYRPTTRGRKTLARIDAAREDAVRAIWATIDRPDLERFASLADDIATRLEAYAGARR